MKKLELEVRSTHHLIGWFIFKGVKILKTRVSLGRGDIPEKVANAMRNQLKLTDREFRDLIGCQLHKAGYIKILKNKGLIR
jgi:hypothetical protein